MGNRTPRKRGDSRRARRERRRATRLARTKYLARTYYGHAIVLPPRAFAIIAIGDSSSGFVQAPPLTGERKEGDRG